MKFYLILYFSAIFWHTTRSGNYNIICYYDASSLDRKGIGNAVINSLTLKKNSLNLERDMVREYYNEATSLNTKHPHVKFLLSLGGGRDTILKVSNKYIQQPIKKLIDSALYLMRSKKFDGLDLAFQFPTNFHNAKSLNATRWKSLRELFTKKSDETEFKENDYKWLFSIFIENLKKSFEPHDFMLTLIVLPNINVSLYFNASTLIKNLDFVNLQTFDFTIPELNPNKASYAAPLYSLPQQGGTNPKQTVEYQVNYWISQNIRLKKLNVGIAAYGRAWLLTSGSNKNGFPKIFTARGSAPAGYIINSPGIVAWSGTCPMLLNALNVNKTGLSYAFRTPDANGEHVVWISYDDLRTAAIKAVYARNRRLGGVAIFDVSLDDFHGIYNGDTFPMLRYIKYTFL